jgi:hypothetical protein
MLLISTTGILFRNDVSVLFLVKSNELAIYLYDMPKILEYSNIPSIDSLSKSDDT